MFCNAAEVFFLSLLRDAEVRAEVSLTDVVSILLQCGFLPHFFNVIKIYSFNNKRTKLITEHVMSYV